MSDLRQILSQGRKRIGLLVGAGAPLAIKLKDGKLSDDGTSLIPGVDDLTSKVLDALTGTNALAAHELIKELDSKAPSGSAKCNVETLLSRIRLLQNAIGTFEIHGLNSIGYEALGKAICDEIGRIVSPDLPSERTAYQEIVSWIGGTQRSHAVEIFTTNYDLLFEEAFERAKAPYFDGFTGGKSPFFDPVTVAGDDLPPRWSRLWKLHGSLGWAAENGVVVRTGKKSSTELVYPDHLKYDLTQKQPYSSLFERLKQFLLTPDTLLLATGFSFRDAHISAVIDECLAINANTAVFAFQFLDLEKEDGACKIAYNHPNLSVYAADGAVISGVSGKWRPGDPPKNWTQIRASFWGTRSKGGTPQFLLGDFAQFSRFCALSQSTDLERQALAASPSEASESLSEDVASNDAVKNAGE
ncbi:SIR2 family NAD-dependent protein deacylase [Asticcacaulis taihuensis]|uniref:SIR2 family NAD-dependent protein deacylase n=1 Tax=Asticcacaulis taihuensis TaxID=260084 RepID=UPI0026E95A3E|nr:SIR2 family protein [Asticcacaulis taihuensis]